VVDALCSILLPGYNDMAMSDYMTLPAAVGEIGSCRWLLFVGVRRTTALPVPPSHPF
jgi:hypothetical protein